MNSSMIAAKFSDGVWGKLPERGGMYEDRTLRLIIFPQYTAIYDVMNADNYISILRQLVDCECNIYLILFAPAD